jgi:hypothetical protein
MPKSELRDKNGKLINRGLSHKGGLVKPLEVKPVAEVKSPPKRSTSSSK